MHSCRFDLLRVMDHHGVASHVVVNSFRHQLCARSAVLSSGDQAERLRFLSDDLQGYYKAHGAQTACRR